MLFLKEVSKPMLCFNGDACKNSKITFFFKEPTSFHVFFFIRAQVRDGGQLSFTAQKVDTPILVPDLPLTHPMPSILGVTVIFQSVSQIPAVPSELDSGQAMGRASTFLAMNMADFCCSFTRSCRDF